LATGAAAGVGAGAAGGFVGVIAVAVVADAGRGGGSGGRAHRRYPPMRPRPAAPIDTAATTTALRRVGGARTGGRTDTRSVPSTGTGSGVPDEEDDTDVEAATTQCGGAAGGVPVSS